MARFNCNGVGIVNSITEAPRPPIEIVAAAVNKAGFSLTENNGAPIEDTQVANVMVATAGAVPGTALTLVNNGGGGYTNGTFTNQTIGAGANQYQAAVNEQTAQGDANNGTGVPNPGALSITYTVVRGQVTECNVGDNIGTNTFSGDTFTINGGDADNLARFMIP